MTRIDDFIKLSGRLPDARTVFLKEVRVRHQFVRISVCQMPETVQVPLSDPYMYVPNKYLLIQITRKVVYNVITGRVLVCTFTVKTEL